MRTESAVKYEGMKALHDKLGKVDAERFVYLILREPFDYATWRETLQDENITLRELSRRAMNDVHGV
jgi:hypothetical protein